MLDAQCLHSFLRQGAALSKSLCLLEVANRSSGHIAHQTVNRTGIVSFPSKSFLYLSDKGTLIVIVTELLSAPLKEGFTDLNLLFNTLCVCHARFAYLSESGYGTVNRLYDTGNLMPLHLGVTADLDNDRYLFIHRRGDHCHLTRFAGKIR